MLAPWTSFLAVKMQLFVTPGISGLVFLGQLNEAKAVPFEKDEGDLNLQLFITLTDFFLLWSRFGALGCPPGAFKNDRTERSARD